MNELHVTARCWVQRVWVKVCICICCGSRTGTRAMAPKVRLFAHTYLELF